MKSSTVIHTYPLCGWYTNLVAVVSHEAASIEYREDEVTRCKLDIDTGAKLRHFIVEQIQ